MQSNSTFTIKHSKLLWLHGLGWKHTVELKNGIEKMYQWYIGNKK